VKIKYLSGAQANIVVKTRNEHCEPHVHAYNVQQNWEFKVFFSFASASASAADGKFYKVLVGKPAKKQIEEVLNDVYSDLNSYRSAWWSVVGKVCLGNRYVVVIDGTVHEAKASTEGAERVHSASFNPAKAELSFDFFTRGPGGLKISMSASCPVQEDL
jgi:hypothetical protein